MRLSAGRFLWLQRARGRDRLNQSVASSSRLNATLGAAPTVAALVRTLGELVLRNGRRLVEIGKGATDLPHLASAQTGTTTVRMVGVPVMVVVVMMMVVVLAVIIKRHGFGDGLLGRRLPAVALGTAIHNHARTR